MPTTDNNTATAERIEALLASKQGDLIREYATLIRIPERTEDQIIRLAEVMAELDLTPNNFTRDVTALSNHAHKMRDLGRLQQIDADRRKAGEDRLAVNRAFKEAELADKQAKQKADQLDAEYQAVNSEAMFAQKIADDHPFAFPEGWEQLGSNKTEDQD